MEGENNVSTENENVAEEKETAPASTEESKVDSQMQEIKDKYLRLCAEFDNYRKRVEKEKSSMFDAGSIEVLTNILPIIDSFERGLSSANESEEKSAFEQGMEMIFNQMMNAFTSMGLQEIEALGKPFDTDFHNAVMHVDDPNVEGKKVVVEVLQKGYIFKSRVIRHSMVKVAN